MMRSQNSKVNNIGRAGCLGLLALGLVLVNPVSSAGFAFAEEVSLEGDELMTQASELVPSSVQIAFGEPVGVSSLTPISEDGASALYSVRATVDVANSGGYTVYLGSSKAELTGKNSGATINGVTSSTSYEGMPVNSWGYAYSEGETAGTTFSAMPANVRGVVLGGNDSANIKTDSKTFTLSFAAHIGNDKPADTYENEVTMSVVSSPLEVTGLTSLTNMQDMTSAVCEASEIGDEAQLKDVRDGKYYWVSKLADGKCWMTQNLDLDLAEGVPLSSATSDLGWDGTKYPSVATTWNPPYTTATTAISSTILANDTGTRSWSLGDYRITNPDTSSSCGSAKNSVANCTSQFTAYNTPTAANNDVNAHYIAGNYYQWNAATAGTGGTITSGVAQSSVCPRNWKLPTSNTGGEFAALVTKLGGTSSTNSVTKTPFYGVRSGAVNQTTTYLFSYAGSNGNYWSSTPSSSGNAYYLYFDGTNSVDPSYNSNRRNGFSVRCVAR